MAGGEEPFDFSTSQIHAWEVERIRQAFRQDSYKTSPHALRRMVERGIRPDEVRDVVINGAAVSKDLPNNSEERKPGINFERTLEDGRRVRVKVSWRGGYLVVTTHEVSG